MVPLPHQLKMLLRRNMESDVLLENAARCNAQRKVPRSPEARSRGPWSLGNKTEAYSSRADDQPWCCRHTIELILTSLKVSKDQQCYLLARSLSASELRQGSNPVISNTLEQSNMSVSTEICEFPRHNNSHGVNTHTHNLAHRGCSYQQPSIQIQRSP